MIFFPDQCDQFIGRMTHSRNLKRQLDTLLITVNSKRSVLLGSHKWSTIKRKGLRRLS